MEAVLMEPWLEAIVRIWIHSKYNQQDMEETVVVMVGVSGTQEKEKKKKYLDSHFFLPIFQQR